MVSTMAMSRGCHQVLWLYGPEEKITEVGTMNIMLFWKNEKGGSFQEKILKKLTDYNSA